MTVPAPARETVAGLSAERCAELRATGLPVHELAELIGVSRSTLYRAGWKSSNPANGQYTVSDRFELPREPNGHRSTDFAALETLWRRFMKRNPKAPSTVAAFVAWLPAQDRVSTITVYNRLRAAGLTVAEFRDRMGDTRFVPKDYRKRRSDAVMPEEARAVIAEFVATQRAADGPLTTVAFNAWRAPQNPKPICVHTVRVVLGDRSWRDIIADGIGHT